MGLVARIRLPGPPASPAAAVSVAAAAGPELEMDELEQVVGGLERAYLPGLVVAD